MKTVKITKKIENVGIVSVVVPVYNAEKFLAMSLQSLLRQTYPYWEAILVNDGSTDGSLKILRKYASADSRFKVIDKPNGGVASARNAALNIVGGQFVAFLDPDDMLYPQFMEIMLKALLDNQADMVACNFKKEAENATIDDYKLYNKYKMAICHNPVQHFLYHKRPKIRIACINKIFRKEFLLQNRFCEEFRVMAEDFYFIMTMFSKIKKAVIINEKLFAYRQNSASLSHRPISFAAADDHVLLLEKLSAFFIGKCRPRLYEKIRRHLSKMMYEFCCLRPYLNSDIDHIAFWRRYFHKFCLLKSAGIFDDRGLPLIDRICFKKFYNGDIDIYEKYLDRRQKLRRIFKF